MRDTCMAAFESLSSIQDSELKPDKQPNFKLFGKFAAQFGTSLIEDKKYC